jgi:hypothetical protein
MAKVDRNERSRRRVPDAAVAGLQHAHYGDDIVTDWALAFPHPAVRKRARGPADEFSLHVRH